MEELIQKYRDRVEELRHRIWFGDEIGYAEDHREIYVLEEIISDLLELSEVV